MKTVSFSILFISIASFPSIVTSIMFSIYTR